MIKLLKFREEDTGGASGGGEQAPGERGMSVFDEEPKAQEPVAPAEPVAPTESPKPEGGLDAKALAAEFGSVLKEHLKPAVAGEPEKPPLTQEEAKKLLRVWEPDDAFLAEFGNMDTQKKAFEKFRDGLLSQFDTLAQYRMQELHTKLASEYQPAVSFVQQREEVERADRFTKQYPEIGEEKLQPIVAAVANNFRAQKKQFDTESEMFKAIADGVASIIRVNQPDFKISGGSTPPKTAASGRPTNAIPVTSPGGGGGGGGQESQSKKPRGLAIFDKN